VKNKKKVQEETDGYSSTQLYHDADGKGAMLGTLAADDNAAKNMATLRPGGNNGEAEEKKTEDEEETNEQLEININDTLNALFEGSNASPEFVEKIKTVFIAALNEKLSSMEDAMVEASKEIIQEQIQENVSSIVEHVDQYLNYVVEEWSNENKLAIENGFRTEIAENFILGLKELFQNSFIDVPEEKYDILDDLFNTNAELEKAANEVIAENLQLKNEILAHKCAESFIEISENLADTEVEKLAKLSENIEFDSVEQYTEKVKILKESYFGPNAKNTMNSDETTATSSKPTGGDPLMENYVKTISNQLKLTNTPRKN
jgi:hypothetical protein